MNDPRGSIWRKWDLHFHTPSSFEYRGGLISNHTIIDTLKANEISVVAITDHHVIDIARIEELKQLGGDILTILPGIELRTEHAASEHIHYIGIFPEDADISYIWSKLQGRLDIAPKDIEEKGNERVFCKLNEASKLIHDLGGIISVHAGKKGNTLENITNAIPVGHAIKEDILRDIDIFEMGKANDILEYKQKVIPNIRHIKVPPMILCSDNHNIAEYKLKETCWIKADPTFKGLLQTLYEPGERVFVGTEPEIYGRVRNNRTKYIRTVQIDIDANSTYEEEQWFRNIRIDLNPELVAIIGNKGNGKSALSDIIGLVGNTKNFNHFSFLNDNKFREKKHNKARHFHAQIIWHSGDEDDRLLSETPQIHESENIKYIPQKYLEILCNEEKAEFDIELKKVIFSHVPEDEKLGQTSLDDLIKYQSEVIAENMSLFKEDLRTVNDEISSLEAFLDEEYRNTLNENLKTKKHELKVLLESPPQKVRKPDEAEEGREETEKINKELSDLNAIKTHLEAEIKTNRKKKLDLAKKKALLARVIGEIENFRSQYFSLSSRLTEALSEFDLKPENIIAFDVKDEKLIKLQTSMADEISLIDNILSEDNPESLPCKVKSADTQMNELNGKLNEPQLKYQAYLKALKAWEDKKVAIVGDKTQESSIKYYENIQEYIKNEVPVLLITKCKKRIDVAREIFKKKAALINLYKSLYKPVEHFMTRYNSEEYPVKFDARLEIENRFDEKFFSFVSKKAKGSFCGADEGAKQLRDLVDATDFNNDEKVINILNQIIERLESDFRDDKKEKRFIKKQLRNDNLAEFYNFLFSLDYVLPKYTLRLGDTELNQLSPGEKGALLLIFYLLIDKNDIPLIIDQPEENLDNESVYKLLVNFIKIAKKKRQIIIVTHNPNLAVVCDAEQIIYSKIEKKNKNKVSYTSGGIECPEINRKIIDVLEGTMPAFDNREVKYAITRFA